jgi:hypothetical protein
LTVRLLHIFCAFVYLSTGAVLTLCLLDRVDSNPDVERLCRQPSVVEQSKKLRGERKVPSNSIL